MLSCRGTADLPSSAIRSSSSRANRFSTSLTAPTNLPHAQNSLQTRTDQKMPLTTSCSCNPEMSLWLQLMDCGITYTFRSFCRFCQPLKMLCSRYADSQESFMPSFIQSLMPFVMPLGTYRAAVHANSVLLLLFMLHLAYSGACTSANHTFESQKLLCLSSC